MIYFICCCSLLTVLESKVRHWFQQPITKSPVAKKHDVEQPIGTTISEIIRYWPKIPHHGLNAEPGRGAEV